MEVSAAAASGSILLVETGVVAVGIIDGCDGDGMGGAAGPDCAGAVGWPGSGMAVATSGATSPGATTVTPEVLGDYMAGPSHVLPTGGGARFQSALGVEDFLRRSHRLRFTAEASSHRAAAAATLADAEGLPAHAAAARRRLL